MRENDDLRSDSRSNFRGEGEATEATEEEEEGEEEEEKERAGKSLKGETEGEENGPGDGPAGEADGNKGGEQVASCYVPFFSPPSNKTFRSFHSLLPFHFSPACRYLPSSRHSSYEKTFQIPVSSIPRRLIVVRSRNQNLGSHCPPISRKAAIEHSREISDARLYETVIFTIFIPHPLSVNKYMCV